MAATKVHPKQLKQGTAVTGDALVWDGTAWTPGVAATVYLRGNSSTDGSVRLTSTADYTAKLQTRIAGTWTDLTVFD